MFNPVQPSSAGDVDAAAVEMAAEAFNRGDVDGYLRHFEPECLRWVVGFDTPLDRVAVESNVREMTMAFESLTLSAESLFGAGGQVCARWRLRGTHVGDFLGIPGSGRTVDLRTCEVYEMRAGLAHTVWTYGDPLDIVRQLEGAR